jgi:plasmid stabilization system protein ParE
MRLIWSLQAIEDVEAIRTYVARDSEQYANLLIDRIIAAVDRLEGFPLSGRVVPEVGDESLREVIYRNYRIVYRLKPEIIEIVTVFHAARLLRLE